MKYLKYLNLILIIILIAFMTTGCWDLDDIDKRAIVIAIGVDFAE